MADPTDPAWDAMIHAIKNKEITDEEAHEFFGDDYQVAAGTAVAMHHIDASDKALSELSEMEF